MPASRYLRDLIHDWVRGTSAPAAPASVYLHLCTTAPTATAVGTAPTITGYAPVEIQTADWAAPALGASLDTLSNDVELTFGPFTGATQTASHAMLMDGADPGTANMIAYGALAASRDMVDGGTLVFAVGDLDFTA